MKLRHSAAAAAMVTALVPAVWLASPAAFAAGHYTTPSVESTATPAPSTSADGQGTTSTQGSDQPSAPESAPAGVAPTGQQTSPAGRGTGRGNGKGSGNGTGKATASPSGAPAASPGDSGSDSDSGNCLNSDSSKTDKKLHTGLSGLPDKVTAGSGFHTFQLNVANKGGTSFQRVDLGVFAAQTDANWDIGTGHLTLQYQDPQSGKWIGISLDANSPDAGYLGYTDVGADESFSINLRIGVDKTAPAGTAFAISAAAYADGKGDCVFSDDGSVYEFQILAAGTDAGQPGNARPQGGVNPLPVKPVGDTHIAPSVNLAETGTSSQLPIVATSAGVAIVLGAGVLFALKRRRGTGTAA